MNGEAAAHSPKTRSRGRPSKFDRNELLDAVMALFWQVGYSNLSFNEIAKAVGLTRASLYNAFETKEQLFLESLSRYFLQAPDTVLDRVQEGDVVGEALYSVFEASCKIRSTNTTPRGCMAVNCMNELLSQQTPLSQTLENMYEQRRLLLKSLVAMAKRQGELNKTVDEEVTANMILAFMGGFSVFSKKAISEEELLKMCRQFLENIGFTL